MSKSKMQTNRSVSNVIAKGTLQFLDDIGFESHLITEKCGISSYEIEKCGGRLNEEQHYKIMLESAKHGKFVVQKILEHCIENRIINLAYNNFPELIGFNLNQKTAGKAIESFVDNRFIIGNCDSMIMTRGEDKTKIEYINMGPTEVGDESAIGNFMMLYDLIKRYGATKNIKIGFTNHHHEEKKLLNDFFENKCSFNENNNFILMDNSLLEKETNSSNEIIHSMQKEFLAKRKSEIERVRPLADSVIKLIEDSISLFGVESEISIMKNVCSALKISRWTLNERLKNENSNFTDLLKKSRLKIACSLLLDTKKSIQEISELVCFSSISVFSRFFKSNLNISPLSYRNKKQI